MLAEVHVVNGAWLQPVQQQADENSIAQNGCEILQLPGRLGGRMFGRQNSTTNQPVGALFPVVGHREARTLPVK